MKRTQRYLSGHHRLERLAKKTQQNRIHKLGNVVPLAVLLLFAPFIAASDTVETFEYDALGRLFRVERNSEELVHYEFDPAGNRVTKTESGAPQSTTVMIYYQGSLIPIQIQP